MKNRMFFLLFFLLFFGQFRLNSAVNLCRDIEKLYHEATFHVRHCRTQIEDLSRDPETNENEMKKVAADLGKYLKKQEKMKNSLIRKIRSRSARLNSTNNNGETALHCAAKLDYPSLVRELLKNGANPTITDKWGMNVLHAATEMGATASALVLTDFVKRLLNTKDKDGKTPLHYASVARGQIPIVKSILSCKVVLDSKDNDEKTPIDIARQSEREDIVEEIKNAQQNIPS